MPNQVSETTSWRQSLAFCFTSDILNLFYRLMRDSKCQGEKREIKQCRNNIFCHYAESIYAVEILHYFFREKATFDYPSGFLLLILISFYLNLCNL